VAQAVRAALSRRRFKFSASGIPTPRINRLVLGYLRDVSGIGQGYDQVLDIIESQGYLLRFLEIPGISQNKERYPKIRKLGMGYPRTNG
jgi:hypothetical protein